MHRQEKQVDHLPKLNEKVQTPEGVPRLYDLVKVKEDRMKLAFFAALGNTVVAKDLDQVSFHIREPFFLWLSFIGRNKKFILY